MRRINYLDLGFNEYLRRPIPESQIASANEMDAFYELGEASVKQNKISEDVSFPLDDGEVTEAKLADAAVTTAKLANLAVDNDKLAALAVDAAKLADSAVESTKIANAAVGSAAIANLAVGTAHIADGAILEAKIGDAAVTNAKIDNLAVTNGKIADATIATAKIADAAISNAKIANAAITNAKIADAAISNAKIADATIQSAKIASLNADVINAGTITGRTLKANGGSEIDVWVENDGVIRFRSGGATRSYIQALGDNSIRFDADNNIQLRADSVDVYYNQDNDGADEHWRSYDDNLRMRLTSGGNLSIDGSYSDGGADFAEMFESVDGKKIEVGKTVVLENDKIREAKKGESPIGVISSNPTIVGNAGGSNASKEWTGKYLKDDFGNYIYEKAEFWRYKKYTGKKKQDYIKMSNWSDKEKPPRGAKIEIKKRKKINPKWDKKKKYIPREERDEWNVVGLLGRVRILKGQPTAPSWVKLRDISDKVEEWLVK